MKRMRPDTARRARAALGKWRRGSAFGAAASPYASFLIPAAFALYNGVLGALHSSLWHGSICVYYLLLATIRGMIILTERRGRALAAGAAARLERRAFLVSSIALLAMNLSLVTPIALMVRLQKPVSMGLIPAITVAAYTTYKVTLASVHFKRKNRSRSLLVRELRTISFIDALLSVVTLQNTLIMVNRDGDSNALLTLTAISSAVFLTAIVAVSIDNLARGLKEGKRHAENAP